MLAAIWGEGHRVRFKLWPRNIHSTTFLIGHFYFAVISTSTQQISSKFSAFYTDIHVCLYRNPLKLANLLSRRVVQLYHY